ncbi:MAG: hypothetical protein ABIF08_02205 [Nanoarchaeota archaeon]
MMEKKQFRGQIYSLIAILIIVPLLIFLVFFLGFSYNISYGSLEKIVADQINDVANDMENDFERAIKISGKRALISAANHIIINGVELSNSTETVKELMLYGTLDGNEHLLMRNNTLNYWRDEILGVYTGFDTNLNFSGLDVTNYDGLHIKATINMVINVTSPAQEAGIDKDIIKEILISTEQLEDVVFALNTGGFVSRIIKRYPYPYHTKKIVTGSTGSGESCSGNITFDSAYSGSDKSQRILVTNDATGVSGFAGVVSEGASAPSVSCYLLNANDAINLTNITIIESGYNKTFLDNNTKALWSLPVETILNEKYYSSFAGDTGPNILMRLENNISQIQSSFETFVNVPEIQSLAGSSYLSTNPSQSVVEYKYFSSQNYNGNTVRGFPSWFKIDSQDALKYELDELI